MHKFSLIYDSPHIFYSNLFINFYSLYPFKEYNTNFVFFVRNAFCWKGHLLLKCKNSRVEIIHLKNKKYVFKWFKKSSHVRRKKQNGILSIIQRSYWGLHHLSRQFNFNKVMHAHTCGSEMPVDCVPTISYFNFLC